jgi:hypothetical protein
MKKLLISAMVLIAGITANAQLVDVASLREVAVPQNAIVNIPVISPDGSFVVFSTVESDGLQKLDLATGQMEKITNDIVGYNVQITDDSRNVVYRNTTFNNKHLRYTGLKSVNLATGASTVLVKPSRNLNAGASLTGSTVTAVENGKVKARSLDGAATVKNAPVVSINYGHLDVTVNGRTTSIDPQGRGSYLWPALSPDGTKVVYYLANRGCFICNIDGSNPVSLGVIRAAKWLDNSTIVGMHDVDNGEFVTSSSLVAANIDGTRQVLTDDSVMAMYPSVDAQGKQIAFATPDGKLYILTLK